MSFINRHFIQLCVLLLLALLGYGCGAPTELTDSDVPAPTPTWEPVPTFTATTTQDTSEEITQRATEAATEASEEGSQPNTSDAVEAVAEPVVEENAADVGTILVPTATPSIPTAADEEAPILTSTTLPPTTLPSTTITDEPYLIVAAEIVNVRLGPGIGYDLVGSVEAEEQLTLIGRNQPGDWWQVCCVNGDQPGWLYGQLVETHGAEQVTVALDIPPLPTAVPTAVEPEVAPEAESTEIVDVPATPAVEAEPVAVEPPSTESSTPPVASGTAGNFDPNAQFQIVHYRVIGYGENNGGIFNNGGQHIIFINVIDENGQGIDGAVVKDQLADDLHIVTGSKGPGRAEFEMFWEPYKLYVASTPNGAVSSQVSNQMNTAKPHIPDIIGKLGPPEEEYAICPTPDDRCEPPFFHAHWSYEITFQKVR